MPRRDGTARQYLDLGLPRVCRRLDQARRRKDWTKRDLGRQAGVDEKQPEKLLEPGCKRLIRIADSLRRTLHTGEVTGSIPVAPTGNFDGLASPRSR